MSVASRTARRVAERRAAHQLLDTPVVLCDPLALKIVGATRPAERARLTATEHGRLMAARRHARAHHQRDSLIAARPVSVTLR